MSQTELTAKKKTAKHVSHKSAAVKQKRKKAATRAAWLSFLLCVTVVSALLACFFFVLKPEHNYAAAEALTQQGSWAKAEVAYKALGNYRDSNEKASLSACISMFQQGKLDDASEAYDKLNADSRQVVMSTIGSFSDLAERALDEKRFSDAYKYYSLDKENPKSADIAYNLDVYIQSEQLLSNHDYAQAREVAASALNDMNDVSPYLQQLIDDSYKAQFEEYEQLSYQDLGTAVAGMESLQEEYEPAAVFMKDLEDSYEAAYYAFNKKQYNYAQAVFTKMSGYKDSDFMARACDIMAAHEKAVNGDMDAAKELLGSVYSLEEFSSILPEDSPLKTLFGD